MQIVRVVNCYGSIFIEKTNTLTESEDNDREWTVTSEKGTSIVLDNY